MKSLISWSLLSLAIFIAPKVVSQTPLITLLENSFHNQDAGSIKKAGIRSSLMIQSVAFPDGDTVASLGYEIYRFDSFGRKTYWERNPFGEEVTFSTVYKYDESGNLILKQYTGKSFCTCDSFSYDDLGRVVATLNSKGCAPPPRRRIKYSYRSRQDSIPESITALSKDGSYEDYCHIHEPVKKDTIRELFASDNSVTLSYHHGDTLTFDSPTEHIKYQYIIRDGKLEEKRDLQQMRMTYSHKYYYDEKGLLRLSVEKRGFNAKGSVIRTYTYSE